MALIRLIRLLPRAHANANRVNPRRFLVYIVTFDRTSRRSVKSSRAGGSVTPRVRFGRTKPAPMSGKDFFQPV